MLIHKQKYNWLVNMGNTKITLDLYRPNRYVVYTRPGLMQYYSGYQQGWKLTLARGELNRCWATLCDDSSGPAGDLSKKNVFKILKKN